MPRTAQTDERRRQIQAALMRVMARQGYAGASVANIAREAGLAPGLVHYYFASKQDILLELIGSIRRVVMRRFDERTQRAGDDPWARLFALSDAMLEHDPTGTTAPIEAAWVVIASEAVHQPAVREQYGAMLLGLVERIETLLREVIRHEGRRVKDARSLASAIAAAIQGVYQMDTSAPTAAKRGTSAPALRQMIAGIVAAQPRRRGAPAPRRR